MFHNISNPKWFGNWSRLEDDYLGNGGTDIADNFTFSKMEKTGGLFGSIIRLATAFPACDPETGHATGAWKAAHRFPKTRSVLPKNRVSVPCSSPPANLRAR